MPDSDGDAPRGLTPREATAVGALAVFVVALIVGGFLLGPAAGCFAAAGAALTIALLVGWRS
jgi:hypothetical protein